MLETAVHPKTLQIKLQQLFGDQLRNSSVALDELTIVVDVANYLTVMQVLQSHPEAQFDQLMDLCAVDYSAYKGGAYEGPRFAVVSHLLSTVLNQRVRVKVFCADDDFPSVPSVTPLWNAANWFEREAFDLFGVVFEGHEDLRRILTDYGFIGHPFRKDFPISGNVEMRYDEVQKRVIYQPVTIDPRENIPRIIREETFGGVH